MKRKLISLGFIITMVFILTACTANNLDKALTEIEEASEKINQLENGKYLVSIYQEVEEVEEKIPMEEGTFVVQDGYVDWYIKSLTGSGYEVVQKEKAHYVRFPEDKEWLNENVRDDTTDYPDNLKSLIAPGLNKDEIESVNITKENNLTIYEFLFNEEYLTSQVEDLIATTKSNLEQAKLQNNEELINYWEMTLEYQESFNFLDQKITLTVDDSGVLVKRLVEGTIEAMSMVTNELQTQTIKTEMEITEYNLDDISIEL